jgi:hypothetical protein
MTDKKEMLKKIAPLETNLRKTNIALKNTINRKLMIL